MTSVTSVFSTSEAFHGFSTDDIAATRAFYADVLGLEVTEQDGMLRLHTVGGPPTLIYPKGEHHVPASFTVLNFPVPDVEAAVEELTARGVVFETYAGTPGATDATGVFRRGGPLIAWFADPAGNVLSVIEQADRG